eukprot:235807_1
MTFRSTAIRLKKKPTAEPTAEHFTFDNNYSIPSTLKPNEVVLKALWISVDPYIRGQLWMTKTNGIITSPQVAQVIKSNSSNLQAGDIISGTFKWATYSLFKDNVKSFLPYKIVVKSKDVSPNMDLTNYLGPLGLIGITAYQGLFDIGKLSKGETVFVSGAAGAVGSIVGQIAKHIMGCTVIGTAGNNDKCKWLTETLGFDKALNYKTYNNNISKFRKDLSKSFGNKGIDLYFDNTGGFQTEAIWDLLNYKGRVIVCGQIANYNKMLQQPKINDFLYKLIYKHIRIEGFAITSFKRYKQFYKDMNQWMDEGKIVYRKTVKCGFDQVPSAFMGLFTGENTGKMLVKISDPQIIKSKL